MKCKSCGKEIQSDFKMCPYCGAAVEPVEEETAFIRLPVEEEQEEDLYEESRKRTKGPIETRSKNAGRRGRVRYRRGFLR